MGNVEFTRVCRNGKCGKRFECYGDCGMTHRLNRQNYCTCPECVAEDVLEGVGKHSYEMCRVRREGIVWSVS